MNIYIFNCSNTFNYGSMMMGENFIRYFNAVSGKRHVYYVETDDEINIQRLKYAARYDEIHGVEFNSLFVKGFRWYDYLPGLISLKKPVSDFAGRIDLVVVLGGDDFTEDYGWKAPVVYALQFVLLRKAGLRVVMLGQTMGPFRSFRVPIMRLLLARMNRIYTRDHLTLNYLEGLGLNNVGTMDDLAMLPLTRQEEASARQEQLPAQPGAYITYCPSELIYRYTREGSRERWIQFNLFLLDAVLRRYPDKKLLLLAHVLKPDHVDDRRAVRELKELLEEKHHGRILIADYEQYPFEARALIKKSYFMIAARMHGSVSALQCGVPSLTLSYSSKFWGVIGESYGMRDYILDVRQMDDRQLRERTLHMLDQLEANLDLIRKTLKYKHTSAEKSIVSALREIAALDQTCGCGNTASGGPNAEGR
ncbi:polysaccharide pyruvyl transferase family protein [Anoxybacterium hadale]|uniref:Polysaccharide pyruvyl transferase family protein n=1 Tax=Anoxybacterium hadale TaxID=3408580 RepID=A0ACD1AF99_9FIRM|nr:polysaccharide pyruvyl transferase family protein [Clostridiales bacterium]